MARSRSARRTPPTGAEAPAGVRDLVIVSDLHCGSSVGLCPPGVQRTDGGSLEPSHVQRWIWDRWVEFTQRFVPAVTQRRPYALVVNGDAIEGVHHRTVQVIDGDTKVHAAAAVSALRPMAAKAAATFVVRGTEAHVGQSTEAGIGKELGAVPADHEHGAHAAHHWPLLIHGCRVSCRHHIGATSRAYLEASQLSIHAGNETLETYWGGGQPAQVFLRGHRHRYGVYENGAAMLVVAPAWQALTNYGHKAVVGARVQVGGVVLSWHGRDEGELPTVHRYLVSTPPIGWASVGRRTP